MRGRYLWDFCTGFPAKYWGKEKEGEPPEKDRIHPGYGDMPALCLTRADVRAWVTAHKKWTTNRAPAAAVLRALNYAVKEVKLLASNPIRGFPLEKAGKRRTYFTAAVQQAMERCASAALALAVKVGIRTGCRPIIEYGSLEARHVEETPRGQLWRFPKEEAKGRQKDRVIYVAEEIAQAVRQQIKIYPTGKLFRDDRGTPWTVISLGRAFRQLRDRLRKAGVEIDDHDVMYTARHTFAKRMLMGYWGKQVSLEVLAGLMGNTPKICWEHYAHFVPSYVDPFWDAVNGGSPGSSPSAPLPSSSPAGAAPVDTRRLPLGARGRIGQATPS
ncbi:MAG: tyrosine-type recombinase/integrase [Thermoguttaceae bacterium]